MYICMEGVLSRQSSLVPPAFLPNGGVGIIRKGGEGGGSTRRGLKDREKTRLFGALSEGREMTWQKTGSLRNYTHVASDFAFWCEEEERWWAARDF